MKVDFSTNIGLYKKNAAVDPLSRGLQETAAKGKTDVVEISRGSTAAPDKSMAALRATVLRDVSYNADAARLQELSKRIKDGTYAVATEELVEAILNSEL